MSLISANGKILYANGKAFKQPSFTPKMFKNCQVWLDANQGVTHSGGYVSQWSDQSGNGFHAYQATQNKKPALQIDVNGNNAILFDGVDDILRMTTQPLTGTGDFSFFAIAKYTGIPSTNGVPGCHIAGNVSTTNANGNQFYIRCTNNKTTNRFTCYNAGVNITPTVNHSPQDIYFVHNADRAAGTVSLRTNEQPDTVAAAAGSPGILDDFCIGDYTGSNEIFQGSIPEIIIYTRSLSHSERLTVVNYLRVKYGI